MIASCSEKAFGVSLSAFLHINYFTRREEYEKTLVMVLFALVVGLTACGSSDNGATNAGNETVNTAEQEVADAGQTDEGNEAEDSSAEEETSEENTMDLSIYPSSNIADFETNGLVLETYDQLYEKIKPLIVETGKQEISGTEYYKDADGNDLLLVFYDGEEVTVASFSEYYENGIKKSEIFTDGVGDSLGYQIRKQDVNGQTILSANQAKRRDVEFMACTVYDYHANGQLATENEYADKVLESSKTYNEKGNELCYVRYKEGQESYRKECSYDADGKLLKVEETHDGKLENWTTYEYDANACLARINSIASYFGENTPYVYSLIETYEDGTIKKDMRYQLDEGKYLDNGEVATDDMYELMNECDYDANGNITKETNYANEYLENGKVADKRVAEFDENGNCTSYLYYDKDGNVISQ